MTITLRRTLQLLLGLLLAVILIAAFWILSSDDDSQIIRLIFDNALTSALFALIVFGAAAGSLALLITQIPKRMSPEAAGRWELVREKGRTAYVKRFASFASVPFVLAVVVNIITLLRSTEPGSLITLLGLVLIGVVFVGAMILAGLRNWKENERQYNEAISRAANDSESE